MAGYKLGAAVVARDAAYIGYINLCKVLESQAAVVIDTEKGRESSQNARRQYVRRYLWRLGPATILAMTTVQLLLDDHPFGAPAVQRFVFVTVFAAIFGLPVYAYLLGRKWDKVHRRENPSQQ
jgi:hypothetical protein